MYAIAVRFDLRNEAAAASFDAMTRRLVDEVTANEPDTLVYATHRVEGAPLARVFYEVYRDRAAFEAHNTSDHVKVFLKLVNRSLPAVGPSASRSWQRKVYPSDAQYPGLMQEL
jgi:quinol monooxygenase YgiN